MAQKRDASACRHEARQKPRKLNRIPHALLGIDDDAASAEFLAVPLARLQHRPAETAIGHLPTTLEIVPSAFEIPAKKQRRAAVVMGFGIIGSRGDRFVRGGNGVVGAALMQQQIAPEHQSRRVVGL